MSKIVGDQTITADGYSAGLNQTEKHPFGDDGEEFLHEEFLSISPKGFLLDLPLGNQRRLSELSRPRSGTRPSTATHRTTLARLRQVRPVFTPSRKRSTRGREASAAPK